MYYIEQRLKNALKENNLSLDETMIQKLLQYLELMQTWNRVFNLTTISEPRKMVYLHIIDSLVVQPYLHGMPAVFARAAEHGQVSNETRPCSAARAKTADNIRCLDVGSGAGLPGIPLAIVNPNQQWVLLDKNSKKTRFMTQAIAELSLLNVNVVHRRCEDFHPAQCFDSILSRAFGSIRLFVETTRHLLCENGLFIAMKGKYPKEELDDIPDGFMVQKVTRLAIKGIDIERHIVSLHFAETR